MNKLQDMKKDIFTFGLNIPIKDLEDLLLKASDAYYNSGNSIMTDAEFDILVDFLRKRSPKSKFLKQIGAPVINKCILDYYLGSMDKIKPPSNKLDNWIKKYKPPYYLSDKLDGISALVIYNDNKIKMFTRGTATHGIDITSLIKYIELPSFNKVYEKLGDIKGIKNSLAIRGEIIMSKNKFKKHSKTFKNARNLVSGLVNSKHKNPIISQDLDLIVYNVLDPIMTFSEQIALAETLGFKTVNYIKKKSISYSILNNIYMDRKKESQYEIDGLIITDNIKRPLQVGRNPEYAFAFKDLLEDNLKDSIVESIEWNISKSGRIIPTVLIKPIELGGVTISRISGNNAKYIKDHGIGKGSKITITRSGDVIPYITKIVKKAKVTFPDYEYEWTESGVDIIIKNSSPKQDIKRIYFFFKTLDTKGFGLKLIEKLYDANFNTIHKILEMKEKDFLTLENVKEKSANNFYNEIKNIRNNKYPIEKFVLATNSLGDNFGSRKAKLIFDAFPDIITHKIWLHRNTWLEKLINIDGIEDKTANQIIDNWQELLANLKWIKKYFTIKPPEPKKNIKNKLKYVKWVLSGFRDKDIENKIIELGGKTSSTISKNTDILVVKDQTVLDNPTSKVSKANELGVKIILKKDVKNFL